MRPGPTCRSRRGTPPASRCLSGDSARRRRRRASKNCGRRAARQPCELASRLGRRASAGPHQLLTRVRSLCASGPKPQPSLMSVFLGSADAKRASARSADAENVATGVSDIAAAQHGSLIAQEYRLLAYMRQAFTTRSVLTARSPDWFNLGARSGR